MGTIKWFSPDYFGSFLFLSRKCIKNHTPHLTTSSFEKLSADVPVQRNAERTVRLKLEALCKTKAKIRKCNYFIFANYIILNTITRK